MYSVVRIIWFCMLYFALRETYTAVWYTSFPSTTTNFSGVCKAQLFNVVYHSHHSLVFLNPMFCY